VKATAFELCSDPFEQVIPDPN
jgi:hypothetical protein